MVNPYQPPAEAIDEETTGKIETADASAGETASIWTRPLTRKMKALLAYVGILVPIGSFLLASQGMPDAAGWQTGRLNQKISFVLTAEAGFVLYPFMLIAMGCLTYYLIYDNTRPTRTAGRLVLFGGVLLTLFYTITLWLVLCRSVGTWLMLVVCQLGLSAIVLGVPVVSRRIPLRIPSSVKIGLLVLLLLGFLAASLIDPRGTLGLTFGITVGFPIVASLVCGPVWAFLAYGFVSLRMAHDPRVRPSTNAVDWIAGTANLIAMIAAIPLSIRLSWMHYSTLPTQPPPGNCYVVTAAARGHRRFVGAWVETHQGETIVLNQQLQRLQMFEFGLADRWPGGHRVLRRAYNRLGPTMAACLRNPWLADVAYLSLKPIEWCAAIAMRVFRFPKRR
jgi:hypothetical protein